MKYKISFKKGTPNQVWSFTHNGKLTFTIRGGDEIEVESRTMKYFDDIYKSAEGSQVKITCLEALQKKKIKEGGKNG